MFNKILSIALSTIPYLWAADENTPPLSYYDSQPPCTNSAMRNGKKRTSSKIMRDVHFDEPTQDGKGNNEEQKIEKPDLQQKVKNFFKEFDCKTKKKSVNLQVEERQECVPLPKEERYNSCEEIFSPNQLCLLGIGKQSEDIKLNLPSKDASIDKNSPRYNASLGYSSLVNEQSNISPCERLDSPKRKKKEEDSPCLASRSSSPLASNEESLISFISAGDLRSSLGLMGLTLTSSPAE